MIEIVEEVIEIFEDTKVSLGSESAQSEEEYRKFLLHFVDPEYESHFYRRTPTFPSPSRGVAIYSKELNVEEYKYLGSPLDLA